MDENPKPANAGKTLLRVMLEEAKARSLAANSSETLRAGLSPQDLANYGRNFENYGRNFENYGRNFENYGRNFENGSSRDWEINPHVRPGVLPDGTRLPPNAATIREAINILANAGIKDSTTLAEAARLDPATLSKLTKPK